MYVFVTNYLNHHQIPFCEAMVSELGEDCFRFVATTPFNQGRIAAGYTDMNKAYDWVVRAYESESSMRHARQLVNEADVALLMPGLTSFSELRSQVGGLNYFVSERILKRGYWWRFVPPKMMRSYSRFLKYKKMPFYALCCGAYDFEISGFPGNKCFNWAYCVEAPVKMPSVQTSKDIEILWVGRMIDLKHPEDILLASEKLFNEGLRFRLRFVGEGPELRSIRSFIESRGLTGKILAEGSLPNDEVRCLMEKASIFVATSDRKEGWGAVVNEAMSSACAVVASDAMGSAKALISDGMNGCLYSSGNRDDLANKLRCLLIDQTVMAKMQASAYETIANEWFGPVAARRLVALTDALAEGRPSPFDVGLCAPAPLLRQA